MLSLGEKESKRKNLKNKRTLDGLLICCVKVVWYWCSVSLELAAVSWWHRGVTCDVFWHKTFCDVLLLLLLTVISFLPCITGSVKQL